MPETTDTAVEEDREQLRAGLLEQLAHLLREVEMLEPVIGRVPEGGDAQPRTESDEAIAVHERFANVPTPLSTMHLHPTDGAVHEVGEDDTAWSHRDARWSMVIGGIDPENLFHVHQNIQARVESLKIVDATAPPFIETVSCPGR